MAEETAESLGHVYLDAMLETLRHSKPGATVCEHMNEPFECPQCRQRSIIDQDD